MQRGSWARFKADFDQRITVRNMRGRSKELLSNVCFLFLTKETNYPDVATSAYVSKTSSDGRRHVVMMGGGFS